MRDKARISKYHGACFKKVIWETCSANGQGAAVTAQLSRPAPYLAENCGRRDLCVVFPDSRTADSGAKASSSISGYIAAYGSHVFPIL